jgi:hypothetical protein
MRVLKVIAGVVCLLAGLYLGLFAWGLAICPFYRPALWFKLVPVGFAAGIFLFGILLILRRSSRLSCPMKWTMAGVLCLLVSSAALLDFHIRQERKNLQGQAKAFLSRPIPKLLIPNSEGEVGGYFVDANTGTANGVFGYSRVLIARYATKGRIRWSAAIQAQFACMDDTCLNPNISENVITNNEVRRYSAESHAILADEWRMGYWQWIEDTIEIKIKIPEIEEEDYNPSEATNSISRTVFHM